MLDALSPQRRRLVLGAAGLVGAVVLALVVVLAVRAVTGRVRPVPQDRPGPVLLVPGYGGRLASLDPLADALRAAGRTVVVVAPPGEGIGDLDQQAEHLAAVARQTLSDTGAPSVDVVGYSAGGVVARLWVSEHGGAGQARRLLTLGAPQHGTSQAALGAALAGGCPTACEQLVPDSALLRELNAGDETPDGPAWVTVRSESDEVVTPPGSAALDGALNLVVQDLCPSARTPHGGLPADPVVLAALPTVLGSGPPAAPPSVAC